MDTDLEQMKIAAAPYGGPIAIVRDSSSFIKVAGATSIKPVIRIFTASGQLISTINVRISLKMLNLSYFNNIKIYF